MSKRPQHLQYQKEQDLVNAVIKLFVSHPKGFAWRNNTGAYKTQTNGFVRYGYPGSPDVIACYDGWHIGVECKVKYNKQTDKQEAFQEAIERAGGIYILARHTDDVQAVLERLG